MEQRTTNNKRTAVSPGELRADRRYTYADLALELNETTSPCELWDGELTMSPAPTFYHQEVVFRFHEALNRWVVANGLGKVVGSPVDMVLSPHRAVQPDVLFVAQARLDIVTRAVNGPADLVAEVVSLEGRRRDRIEKRDLYEQAGFREYWIVDPEAETIEVLFLADQHYVVAARARRGDIARSRLLPGFHVSVIDVLGKVIGEL